jgi:hypothetical protein
MEPARLVAGIVALAAGIAAVAVSADLLHRTPGPVPTASSAPAATPARAPSPLAPRFPAPPPGAVVFSREDGADALALAVVPHGSRMLVQASVVGQQGAGMRGLSVAVGATPALPCGAGCYRATVPRSRSIDLRVSGGKAATRWTVALPSPWPPVGAAALVSRAGHVWRSLRSLAFTDSLASDASHAVVSTWRAVAPDRLTYRIQDGWSAVIIGARRWDRAPRGRWIESPQTATLRQPVPLWQAATDAHVLGSTRTAWRISFFDPRTPAWFLITVDKRTLHTVELHMATAAHFMHETYRAFDAAGSIAPPPTSR